MFCSCDLFAFVFGVIINIFGENKQLNTEGKTEEERAWEVQQARCN